MKHLGWLALFLLGWIMPAGAIHAASFDGQDETQFVLEIRPVFQYIGHGFGEGLVTVPIQTAPNRFVNTSVLISPSSMVLFAPEVLVGARFGEKRRWQIVGGPNVTHNVSSAYYDRQALILGSNVSYRVRTGQSWKVGGTAEVTRMWSESFGWMFGYSLTRYSIQADIVSSSPYGGFVGGVNATQNLYQFLTGPAFQFGAVGLSVGVGAGYGTTSNQYGYSSQWGVVTKASINFRVF